MCAHHGNIVWLTCNGFKVCTPAGVCASVYQHVLLHVRTGAPSLGGNRAEVTSHVSVFLFCLFFFFLIIYIAGSKKLS